MHPIQVAIVGCGRISDLHALGYRGRKDARIIAVCDTKTSRARENARAWGVASEKVYSDYQKLLADPEVDLVELLVPHDLHAGMITATIMFQFKSPRRFGVLDFTHTPDMGMDSIYYADDDRVEVIGEKGILFVNRCTARTVDLPPLMMFRDGETTEIPVERCEWHDSFVDCTRHLIDVLRDGGEPVLDGPTGKAAQFSLAAHISAREGREVRPDEVV